MLLKCETTLNVYQHKDKTILCRVRVMPTKDKHSKSGGHRNTCRSMTTDQWDTFDKELSLWLELDENNDSELDEQLCQFVVKPNFDVKIRKSNLSVKNFYKSVRNGDCSNELDAENVLHIFDCILEYKPSTLEYKPASLDCKPSVSKLPPSPSIPADEYEPIPTAGVKNESTSPLTYEPYTPSKRKRQFGGADKIKTPGLDFLGFDSAEDAYSPKPNGSIATNEIQAPIPVYKPAPISEKHTSNDIDESNVNEFIVETEDEEILSQKAHRSLRTRERTRRPKTRDHGEYIPESQDIAEDVPAYNPTPIEDKKQPTKVPKETEKKLDIEQVSQQQKDRKKPESSEESKKSKVKGDNSSKEAKTDASSKDAKRSSNTPSTSGDEFEKASTRHRDKDKDKDKDRKKKEKRKSKESAGEKEKETKADEKQYTEVKPEEMSISTDSLSSKPSTRDKSRKHSSAVRRSERSPSKPRRFIEEQEKCDRQRQQKSLKSSPTNKELFGTDDDEVDDKKRSDSNNNANVKPTVFHTPKPDKKNTSLLFSSSSSSKKKRKRNDCEQEKAGLNKWLGKKDNNSKGGATSSVSKISASSINEKSSKKQKSSKENTNIGSKSDSPQPMDIVMPSKMEMELMRNKHKIQREENEKLKAALAEISAPPKEVDQLTLRDMKLNELLDTFTIYKNDLDEIYEKNRKKDHVKGHEGINHCLVIGLIDQGIQLKMLEKLSDIYNNTKSTTQATLYANALLPEWIIRVFMEKHKLKRLEAIKHIEDQDAYKSYIDGQNENSFLDDL